MLYYSGEGTTVAGDKCIIPYDADQNKIHSFFKIKDLYSMLNEINKIDNIGDIFVFMDVDFNNSGFKQNLKAAELDKKKKKKKRRKRKKSRRGKPIFPADLIPPKGITTFYAANTTEKSYDHPDAKNGIFTYYMLRVLRVMLIMETRLSLLVNYMITFVKMFLILLKIFILICHRLLSYILKILIEYYYDCHSIDSQKYDYHS